MEWGKRAERRYDIGDNVDLDVAVNDINSARLLNISYSGVALVSGSR